MSLDPLSVNFGVGFEVPSRRSPSGDPEQPNLAELNRLGRIADKGAC